VLGAVEGGVGAFAGPAGVAVVNEARLPDRLQQRAERVMDDPIAEGCGADHTPLAALDDDEVAVGAGAIAAIAQLLGELMQVLFAAKLEGGHVEAAALAAARLPIGLQQVLEAAEPVVEVAEGLGHHIPPCAPPRARERGRGEG